MGMIFETAREGRLCGEDGRDCEGREGCVGRMVETVREGREGCVGRTAETARGGRVLWGGRPRLRGEGGLCREDGRDCEGREGCGDDGQDCEGREGCVGRYMDGWVANEYER